MGHLPWVESLHCRHFLGFVMRICSRAMVLCALYPLEYWSSSIGIGLSSGIRPSSDHCALVSV